MNEAVTVSEGFAESEARLRLRQSLVGCILTLVLVPTGIALDVFVYPGRVGEIGVIRLVCEAIVGLAMGLHYTAWGRRHLRLISFGWVLAPALTISWMIAITEGATSPYYAGLMITIAGVCTLFPWRLGEAVAFCTATIGAYLVACLVHGQLLGDVGILVNNLLFLGMVSAICAASCHFSHRRRHEDYLLRQELDQRRAEVEHSYQQLAEMDRLKSQFFANISHELRTPLTLIIGPLEELLSGGARIPDRVAEPLGIARSNALRLLKLINDLLESARLDAGRREIRPERIDLEVFCAAQVESLAFLAEHKGVDLGFEAAVERGTATVDADPGALEKILVNLLSNAVKFTPGGGRIRLRLSARDEEVLVEVIDTGIGIPAAELPKVFDRFRQVDGSSSRKYQGAGIGLSLASELSQEMGGRIEAESEEGAGTTMRLVLPLATGAAPETTTADDEDDVIARMYHEAERSGGLVLDAAQVGIEEAVLGSGETTVMVVDDEPDMRRYLVSTLDETYRVVQAGEGASALRLAQEHRPAAILLDVMLPGEDGISVCRKLRALELLADTKIVMLTARPDEQTRISCLEAGADDFLTKPFSVVELRTRVGNLLRAHGLQRDLRAQTVELREAMARLQATESQLVQSEKVRALGDMAAGVLHEMGNPLNYAMTALDLAVLDAPDDLDSGTRESITDALEGLGRIKAIIGDLKAFAYPSKAGSATLIPMAEVVVSAARLCSGELDGVAIDVAIPEDLQAAGARDQLLHLFMNLLTNAAKAVRDRKAGPPGRIEVAAEAKDDNVVVRVTDNGVGIPPEIIGRIFDPFFTTRDVQEGMGLGLSLCRTIAEHHGGRLDVTSRPGEGTTFTLTLQAAVPEAAA